MLLVQLELGTRPSLPTDSNLCFLLVEHDLTGSRTLEMEGGNDQGCALPVVTLTWGASVPQVLLCASNQNNSIVECWSLRKEGLPVNNIFQQISPVGKCLH